MGTNYYARQISKIKEIDEEQKEIENELRLDFSTSSSKLQIIISKYFEIKREELPFIHIGKQSAGWKFYFNHNDWQYFTNKETLIKWLYTVEIFDEYSTIHTTDGFLNNHLNRIDGDHAINFKKQYPSCNIEKDGLDFANSTEFR